jgi:4-diphosphocytidyl-2-C-methyl-D-erythritol kinase
MICFPNAKINIGLAITGKRDDGYHHIETVFYPIQLNDILEINSSANPSFVQTGIETGCNANDNLVCKAYRLLYDLYKIDTIRIHLHKNIPVGAGLGGGSSDAANMLRIGNNFFRLGLTQEEIQQLALQTGSDCPFFIINQPVVASGRGEIMQPVTINLSGYYLMLICPGIHISTGEAYSMVEPHPLHTGLKELIKKPVAEWKHLIINDFEKGIFDKYPLLAAIKRDLYNWGALYASMSGSGSSVYGIFQEKPLVPERYQSMMHYIQVFA